MGVGRVKVVADNAVVWVVRGLNCGENLKHHPAHYFNCGQRKVRIQQF